MKAKVKVPFTMGDKSYKAGESLDVNATKAAELASQGLVAGKGVKAPSVDKQVKSPAKSKGKK